MKSERAERFAGRLYELRKGANLTQKELSQRCGLAANTLAMMERGEMEPSWTSVVSIAEALGVSTDAFTEEPAERESTGPGRPVSQEPEPPTPVKGKLPVSETGKGSKGGKGKPSRK